MRFLNFVFIFLLCASVCRAEAEKSFSQKNAIEWQQMFEHGKTDFRAFWERCARDLAWFQPWETVLEWDPPFAKWFKEGTLNACYNCVDRHLKMHRNKAAIIWEDEKGRQRTLTYFELHREIVRFAAALREMGVQKGDRIAIYMPMVPEAVVAMLASARIGAIHTVIFGGMASNVLQERINDAQAKVLITANGTYRKGKYIDYKKLVDTALQSSPTIEQTIFVENIKDHASNMVLSKDQFWYHDLIAKAPKKCPCEKMNAEDTLFILYTSGTTGKPKGIMHSTGGYLVGVHATFKWIFDVQPQDVYWSTADIGWITGHSYLVYGPLSHGSTIFMYEGAHNYPDVDVTWQLIEKHGISIYYTAPTLIRLFMKWGEDKIQPYDISSLRLIGSIGEPLNPEAWHWYNAYVGRKVCPIVDTWFQTETGAFVLSPIPGGTHFKPGSVIQALPGYSVDVLDEAGASNHKGYLAILKPFPSMLRGFFGDQERYKKTYWSMWDKPYYFAGDAARKDEDGDIWVEGRSDEVMKVNGHRIGTAEVENALVQNLVVAEAAVIGVSDSVKGQAIAAFIVLKDSVMQHDGILDELQLTVKEYLGAFARPDYAVFVNALPKNRSGKILRRILRSLLEEKPLGNVVTLKNRHCLRDLEKACVKMRAHMKERG